MMMGTMALASCSKSNDSAEGAEPQYIQNNPLPVGKSTLKVLAIGNSYTIDGTACIRHILNSTSVQAKDYCVYALSHAGASLEYWDERFAANDGDSIMLRAGSLKMPTVKGSISELMAQDWDIIVMQQYSAYAHTFSTYNPYLNHLLAYCKTYCTNSKVAFAWQLIHSYAPGYYLSSGLAGEARWRLICRATQEMKEKVGIDIVIPTGTAIQNARKTSLQTEDDLTRDMTHLCYGVGRHIAGLTWVQTLFAPVFNFTIQNNTANHALADWEKNDASAISGSSVPVTDENRDLCIDCALKACENPYTLSH